MNKISFNNDSSIKTDYNNWYVVTFDFLFDSSIECFINQLLCNLHGILLHQLFFG